MVIKYKDYIGTVEYMERIKDTADYKIAIRDTSDVLIRFSCNIHDIQIPKIICNEFLFENNN